MKQALKLPALEDLIALLNEEPYREAQYGAVSPKELVVLKKAVGSLAEKADRWNTLPFFYTLRPFLVELCALNYSDSSKDTKALPLYAKIKFKINFWNCEKKLTLAIRSTDVSVQSNSYLELGLLYQQSSIDLCYQKAFDYFTKVISLENPRDKPLALRRHAELYLEKSEESKALLYLQKFCRLVSDNLRSQVEYGRALITGRYREVEAVSL
jgi:tetratricopeptide (TPR) repeat protein